MSKRVPEVRFVGFNDEWEEHKLSEGLNEYTDRVLIEDDQVYNQISVRNSFGGITLRGSKIGSKIGRKRQAKINLTKYPQTLIFTRQTIEQGGIGWAGKGCDGAIVTENMPTISLDTSVFFKDFLTIFFQTRIFYKKAILDNIEGGSAQIAVHEDKLLATIVMFPNIEEQQKIGSFFKQLDNLIDLHQRKLDLLKEQKKGFLQKMFPQDGAMVPEVRFAGFSGDWVGKKLGDLAAFSKGKGYTKNDLTHAGIPIILYGSMYVNYQIVIDRVDTFVELKNDSVISEGGEVIVPTSGESAEDISIASVIGVSGLIIGGDLNIIKPTNDLNSVFLALSISNGKQKKGMSKRAQGKSIVHLHNSDLQEVNLTYPSYLEQQKIGTFFEKLDDMITSQKHKLDLLKEQKKGFLQKMFV